jgi:hypothetical protein
VALIALGCAAPTPVGGSIQATPQPTSNVVTPPPDTAATPTPSRTKAPTPIPQASPSADKVAEFLIPYGDDSYYAHADVIAEIKNIGATWIKVEAFESDYTIYDQAGDVVTTGNFSYAFPRYLAPGETGYLGADVLADGVKTDDMKRVEVNAYFNEADESEAIVLIVESSKNRAGGDFDGTTTTGKVKNTSSEDVDSFHVGAFYLDASNKPLGFSYTNLGQNLAAGQSKAFETIGSGPNVPLKSIKNTRLFAASSFDF